MFYVLFCYIWVLEDPKFPTKKKQTNVNGFARAQIKEHVCKQPGPISKKNGADTVTFVP